jgi:arabinogalactan oligomer/maltooligosaccharide transport system permease protein
MWGYSLVFENKFQKKDVRMVQETKPKSKQKKIRDERPSTLASILWKIGLLGLTDAIVFLMIMVMVGQERIVESVVTVLVAIVINWIYLRKGGLPAKYLAPGVLFLIVFQVYVLLFSGYTAFTNYGSAHNGDQSLAINTINNAAYRVVDGEDFTVSLVKDNKSGERALLLTSNGDGQVYIGKDGAEKQLVAPGDFTLSPDCADKYAEDTTNCAHAALTAKGYTAVNANDLSQYDKNKYLAIRVVLDPNNKNLGIKTGDFSSALPIELTLSYDAKTKWFTALVDDEFGNYVAGDVFKPATDGYYHLNGDTKKTFLEGGWRVEVGFKNFATIFTDEQLRAPLFKVISWTFIFAFSTVLTTFVLGMAVALLFNHEKLRFKRAYRSIMILPYAFPAFLSVYVWVGLFNKENGFINTVILGQTPGADTNFPWLTEEGPARLAVLLVNLWLGFPYMFLITTGALQSIPSELTEAATIDGASPWQNFRFIKLPLLLVSIAPLLISSFAFNFNNFTIIYLLTKGGPNDSGVTDYDVGGTDILITFVYKIAFSGTGQNYGLASAFSILIFLVVGTLSLISFRRTRTLEDIN